MGEPPSPTPPRPTSSSPEHRSWWAPTSRTPSPVDVDRWVGAGRAPSLAAEGARGELTLTFVDRDEIAALNAEHLGKDGPDRRAVVPARRDDEPQPGVPVLLGDVVVCPAVAADQAPAHAGTVDDELALLVVHGVLHVLGHDHAEPAETAAMRAPRAGAARGAPLARRRRRPASARSTSA